MATTISSETDIETWLVNSGFAADIETVAREEEVSTEAVVARVRDELQELDHPAYGTDWAAWLATTVTSGWISEVTDDLGNEVEDEAAERLTGHEAIDRAERDGLRLGKLGDPTEGPREGLTVDEARAVAAEDPALIYLDVPAS